MYKGELKNLNQSLKTPPWSLLHIEDIKETQIQELFSLTRQLKEQFKNGVRNHQIKAQREKKSFVLVQAFLEPSTRTRISFEIAAKRLGVSVINQDFLSTSSLIKGESIVDTLKVIEAMDPDLLVIRYDGSKEVHECLKSLCFPSINGGAGRREHPTQALLDAFTVMEVKGKIKGQNILIVGDICHSRVASSDKLLFERLGANVAVSSPKFLWERDPFWKDIPFFQKFEEGLKWCDVCVLLRWQRERHSVELLDNYPRLLREEGVSELFYQMNDEKAQNLSKESIILHPGPVIWGREMSASMKYDSRCQILRQVTNGVYLRMALIAIMLKVLE